MPNDAKPRLKIASLADVEKFYVDLLYTLSTGT
jgi:hypothetical protein